VNRLEDSMAEDPLGKVKIEASVLVRMAYGPRKEGILPRFRSVKPSKNLGKIVERVNPTGPRNTVTWVAESMAGDPSD
jgi:hypothetical protein